MEIGKYKGYEMNSAVSIGLKKVYLGTDLKNSEAPYIVLVLDGSRSFIPEEEEVYHGMDYIKIGRVKCAGSKSRRFHL